MKYIDVACYDDYDTIIRFLLEKKVKITARDKMRLVIVAELPEELLTLLKNLPLQLRFSIGEEPLTSLVP